jgi:hypothetical protein
MEGTESVHVYLILSHLTREIEYHIILFGSDGAGDLEGVIGSGLSLSASKN